MYQLFVLFDYGTSYSFISKWFAKSLFDDPYWLKKPYIVGTLEMKKYEV